MECLMLTKPLKTISLLFTTTFLFGSFYTLPSLAMTAENFDLYAIPSKSMNQIIKANPKNFAQSSKDYHVYVCERGFIGMYIGKHKVHGSSYLMKKYGKNDERASNPKYYNKTDEEERLQVQSLDGTKGIFEGYVLPPLYMNDICPDQVISLLNNPAIAIKELKLRTILKVCYDGDNFFEPAKNGALQYKIMLMYKIAETMASEMHHKTMHVNYTDEEIEQVPQNELYFPNILRIPRLKKMLLERYEVEKISHLNKDCFKNTLSLLNAIENHQTLKTLCISCTPLYLLEDALLESLGKNTNLTSLSINLALVSAGGQEDFIDYLSNNKTLKNLKLKNLCLGNIRSTRFERLGIVLAEKSIPTSMSISGSGFLAPVHQQMLINYLRNTNGSILQKITLKGFRPTIEGALDFKNSCIDICKGNGIELKIFENKLRNPRNIATY